MSSAPVRFVHWPIALLLIFISWPFGHLAFGSPSGTWLRVFNNISLAFVYTVVGASCRAGPKEVPPEGECEIIGASISFTLFVTHSLPSLCGSSSMVKTLSAF